MAFRELSTKYKFYTILCAIIFVLAVGDTVLGILLSNKSPSTKALTSGDYEYEIVNGTAEITYYEYTSTTS